MRIHTNAQNLPVIAAARNIPGVDLPAAPTVHGSRTHTLAYELSLTGNSRRGSQWGNSNHKSATWDEWGAYLSALYAADPTVKAGPYTSADHFHWVTGDRFRAEPGTLPDDTHRQHRWEYTGTAATGTYTVQECTKCHALTRTPRNSDALATILEN